MFVGLFSGRCLISPLMRYKKLHIGYRIDLSTEAKGMDANLKPSNNGQEESACARYQNEILRLKKRLKRLNRIKQGYVEQVGFMLRFAEMLPMGIAVHVNGIITYINPAGVATMRARSARELVGRNAFDFIHPNDIQTAQTRINQLVSPGSDASFATVPFAEEQLLDVDGNIVDVELAAFLLEKTDSETSILVIFHDVSERKRQQQEQSRHMARFRQLISLLPDATIIHRNGVVLFANQTALNLLGYPSEEEIIGRSVFDFLHPDEYENVRKRIRQVVETRAPLPPVHEYVMRTDGETFLAETMAIPFEEGDDSEVLVVLRDVTEKEKMLKALEKSEAKFRMLAELLPASVFVVDEAGSLIYLNATSEIILGFSLEESLGVNYRDLAQSDSLQNAMAQFGGLRLDETANFELQVKDKQDKWVWLDVRITKTVMDDQVVGLGVATDITWRKETEALLKRQAQKLVKAYEDERGRIARELHDEVGQQLIGMKFALERAQHFTDTEAGSSAIQKARQMLADLTEMVRELSLSFRPPMLDDLGLLPTLLWHFERYTKRTGIQVQFRHSGLDARRLPKSVEISVFRIIQESLTNVARYAQVDAVQVTIRGAEDQIELFIRDHGVGFDFLGNQGRYASSGIPGMMERAELLGGQLHVESAPGQGVTITATLPLLRE